MITISRVTDASYAPIPLVIRTDKGAWDLTIPGPMSHQRIYGDKIHYIDTPARYMYMFTVVADGQEYDMNMVNLADLDKVKAITISDGFLYDYSGREPTCTYQEVTGYTGYPELADVYYIGRQCP